MDELDEGAFSLEAYYDAYPRVEEEFRRTLDASLQPDGPESLYNLVASLGLPRGAIAIDVGCGEGGQAVSLAERFGFNVIGFDPVLRHIELARERLHGSPALSGLVRFDAGSAEQLPLEEESAGLVWCRDVLVHVERLDLAYAEFRRVLAPGGRIVLHLTSLATERLEPKEAEWLFRTAGIVPSSAVPDRHEAAIETAGLRIDEMREVGLEWAEWSEERGQGSSRRLLRAIRLLRDPDLHTRRFGKKSYDIMLADCLWHVYHAIGKLGSRVYVLSRP